MKGLVKLVYYAIAAVLGSAVGSALEDATMSVCWSLDGGKFLPLQDVNLAQLTGQADRLSSATFVDLGGLVSFSVPGTWIAWLPEPLLSLLFLAAAWRFFRNW